MDYSAIIFGYLVIAFIAAIVIFVRTGRDPLEQISRYSEGYSPTAHFVGNVIAAIFWPVGLVGFLIQQSNAVGGRLHRHRQQDFQRRLDLRISRGAEDLSQNERSALVAYLFQAKEQSIGEPHIEQFDRLPPSDLLAKVQRIWETFDRQDEADLGESSGIKFSEAWTPPPVAAKDEWGFHMTNEFRKSVKCLDKSMRGRVLDAITDICIHPMEVRGDTVKPLTGELAGCWRYRLGDYRLIYQPIKEAHRIDLITIGGRGSIYVH